MAIAVTNKETMQIELSSKVRDLCQVCNWARTMTPAGNNSKVRWQSYHFGLTWYGYNYRHTSGWKPLESRQRFRRPVSGSSANLPSAWADIIKPISH